MQLIKALLVAAMLLPFGASAAGATRPLAHYTHQRWSEESDPPRPVVALAQDRSGYLWIASAVGLFRFDGIRFEMISAGVDLVVHGAPSAILVRRNGEVWTNFERSRRFAVYREGRLHFVDAPPAPHRVSAMQETRDGTIWVLTEQIGIPLMRFRNGQWTSFGPEASAPVDNPFSMVVTGDGTVWVSFSDGSVERLAPDGRLFQFVRKNPGGGRLSIDPQERIWLTERRGTYPITGPGGLGTPPPLRHAYATDAAKIQGWPMFDRAGNLWIATYHDGLQYVAQPDPRGAASPAEAAASVERFTARDGLSANVTRHGQGGGAQLFQDAEGNVWLGTEGGLDRFWPATLRFEPQLADPALFGDLLLQASDGSVYIGQASTVYRVRPGGRPEPILRTRIEPRTLCEAPDGAIWIGTTDKQVVIWREGRMRRLGQRAPLGFTIYDCAFDAQGDYWITAALGGMARFRSGRWEQMFGPAGGAFVPKSMLADARGRLFVHWNERTLSLLDRRAQNAFPIPFGGYEPDDAVVLDSAAPDTLFVAGRFGLARLRDGRFQTVYARQAPFLSDVKGMVRTPAGDMWFGGPDGIVRMTAAQLKRALGNPSESPSMQLFGAADGLRSRPHSHSRHAIVQGGDGRLWIATQTGTLWLDPADIISPRMPPRVAVSGLSADRVYRDPSSITLPAGTSNIEIDFAVLAFSNLRSARVRYRIEGQDPDWIEAGTRRQAFYTNLPPGTYRFQVIAANGDGAWNEEGATVAFEIPPTFFQSRWFLALCILLALVPLWLLYRLRVAQVARGIAHDFNLRLDERVNERTRIARELHDTLLQSFQGLMLRFQSARDQLPAHPADALEALDGALDRADQAIAEGRDAIQNLRSSTTVSHELAQAITSLAEELTSGPEKGSATFRMSVEGSPRDLNPIVRDDISRIAREALRNAFRHAQASQIEAEVTYGARELRVRIRDDGTGIDAEHLNAGRARHWGLTNMRERAREIGSELSLWSEVGAGTEVELRIPDSVAYMPSPRPGSVRRLFGGFVRKGFDR